MSYFSKYPQITITNPVDDEQINIVDIYRRLKISGTLKDNKQLYTTYYIKDNERPEQIAFNYYGDTKYYWTILLANNICKDDWVLNSQQIENILYNTPNQNTIIYHETLELKNKAGYVVIPKGLKVNSNFSIIIDGTLFNNTKASLPITYRDKFINDNEQKRIIILLDPAIVSKLDDDFGRLINYQTSILTNNNRKYEEI